MPHSHTGRVACPFCTNRATPHTRTNSGANCRFCGFRKSSPATTRRIRERVSCPPTFDSGSRARNDGSPALFSLRSDKYRNKTTPTFSNREGRPHEDLLRSVACGIGVAAPIRVSQSEQLPRRRGCADRQRAIRLGNSFEPSDSGSGRPSDLRPKRNHERPKASGGSRLPTRVSHLRRLLPRQQERHVLRRCVRSLPFRRRR